MPAEILAQAPEGENNPAAAGCLATLTAKMGPGFNRLAGNENLENAYLDYRAAVLDEQHLGAPNYYHFDQLPEYEQRQAHSMVDQLAMDGIAAAPTLRARLQRMRILEVDVHQVHGKERGGQFCDGLVIVAGQVNGQPRTPQQRNHAKLHEIVHGLAVINDIVSIDGQVFAMSRGLTNRLRARGTALATLNEATEAIVDRLALSVSDIDADAYTRGAMPDVGYWEEGRALDSFTASHPDIARSMREGTFTTGLRDREKGVAMAEAYRPYAVWMNAFENVDDSR